MSLKKRRCCEPISPEMESELFALMEEGRTIEAIKRLRAATAAPLADCKAWVEDQLLRRYGGIPRKWTGRPCSYCGKTQRTDHARQCFECGMDWHEPGRIKPSTTTKVSSIFKQSVRDRLSG